MDCPYSGPGASVDDHLDIYHRYKNGESTYEEARQSLLELWWATGNTTRQYFMKMFKNIPLLDEAKPLIDELSHDYRICLITGSMDMYAEIIATRLGVSDYYANTTLTWNDNGELVNLDYELDQSGRKLEQFLEYCSLNKLDPSECIVVGDGDNNLALFEATNRGVAVGTEIDEKLEAVAWKTISTIDQLPDLLRKYSNE